MSSIYTPSTEEEYMNSSQLQYFKTKLLVMKQEYDSTSIMRQQELSHPKSDLNDETYNSSDMEIDLISENSHTHTQKEIADALNKIDNMSYGYCEDTGEPIGIKRLLANPIAKYCIQTQEKYEAKQGILSNIQHNIHGN